MKRLFKQFLSGVASFLLVVCSASGGTISQVPLYLATTADPNVLFNMSVETPMGGAAYNDQPGTLAGGAVCGGRDSGTGTCYFKTETYIGYFDSKKCYQYNSTASPEYFYPTGAANSDHECSGAYSGNFMNWASMTAMDMFIWTMTGGNRISDTSSETIVKRAKKHSSSSWFPPKRISSSDNVTPSTVTPWTNSTVYIENTADGIQFGSSSGSSNLEAASLNIKVCDSSVGLESNCIEYTDGSTYYKPEGLIQRNADSMRFAVTSYSLDGDNTRDGGILRANMKYVGQTKPDGSGGTASNTAAEITAGGLLVSNPNPSDATASGVSNSGVINYINKFSHEGAGYKSLDPASELYYESLRYFKNLGRTPEYADGLTVAEKGGFPAITSWEDPIQYSCQKNFIVGINDANPWLDKRLPGTHFTSASFSGHTLLAGDYGEPSNADSDIDVTALTNKVGELEGLKNTSQCVGCVSGTCDLAKSNKTIPDLGEVMGTCPSPQKENSYYIAGLAYYANTTDLRTESGMSGTQSVSTFMIDTQEYSDDPLTGQMNMLWLAGKYGGFIDSNNNNEPDVTSEWDEDGDGEPDNYVLASRPDKLVAALSTNFSDIEERSSTASAITTNSTRLDTNTLAFRASFNSGNWSGEFEAYPVNSDGSLGSVAWNAADELPSHGSRKIYSWDPAGSAGFVFDATSSNLTIIQATAAALDADRVNYLRGDTTNEQRNSGLLRSRPVISNQAKVLGDIVNSDPLYVSTENFGYEGLGGTEGSAYATFRSSSSYKGRKPMLYVGANDGMLHGFYVGEDSNNDGTLDADSDGIEPGEEVFAFVPKSVYGNLEALTKPNYTHKYYVDGSPHVGDAYIDPYSTGDAWRSVLVATTGAGGTGVFALDVTEPDDFKTTSTGAARVLWELDNTVTNFTDLGYTLGKATIVKLESGHWAAVFANGYGSSSGKAIIYIVDLEDGSLIKSFDSETTGNGMSTPVLVDTDGNFKADTIYAGDLKGNLWKIDISSSNTNQWDFSHRVQSGNPKPPLPIFIATDQASPSVVQSITAKPQVGKHSGGGYMVYFGTGKYYETNDNIVGNSPQVHTFYGIRDYNDEQVNSNRSELVQQSVLAEGTLSGFNIRVTSDNTDSSKTKGWYMNLKSPGSNGQGERVTNEPILRGDRVLFTTLIPNADPCDYGGSSWFMELEAESGSRLADSPFDINNDGLFNDSDKAQLIDLDNDLSFDLTSVSGVQKAGMGIIDNPAILETGSQDIKIISGSSGNTQALGESNDDPGGRQAWQQLQ